MQELIEFTIENREDIWKIPPETKVIRIDCGLAMHAAKEIVLRCRELDKIIFSGNAFNLTEREVRDYLNAEIYHIAIEGEFTHHGVPPKIADAIKKLYARGDHNLDSLALKFRLPKEKIWHIIHGKAPPQRKKLIKICATKSRLIFK